VKLQALIIGLLLLSCTLTAQADVARLVTKVDSAVVILKTTGRNVSLDKGGVREVAAKGLGTGVLVDAEGHVVTAAHVVQTADEVVAEFVDGSTVSATVVSSDPELDLALLRLDEVPSAAKPVSLGDSDKLKTGEEVVVIGSPFGLSHSVSRGIVSGKHRPKQEASGITGTAAEIIQTDAAINKGNSGGPMFNSKGEVVGIVSFILSQSGGFEGIGFAISSNTAKEALFDNPMFWSGLESVLVQGDLAAALNVGFKSGMLIQKVAAGSLADKLGLRAGKIPVKIAGRDVLLGGDIVVSLDGLEVSQESVEQIRQRMKQLSPNDLIKLEVRRNGRLVVLETRLPPKN
jgi:S1-C subfamily serine protease